MKGPMLYVLIILSLACKKDTAVQPAASPTISAVNCSSASFSGSAVSGASFSGSLSIPYSGGNGVAYSAGSAIQSSGVTGLTATLQPSTLANGAGTFSYVINGTPSAGGTASFLISFNGRSCTAGLTVGDAPLVQYGTPFANVADRQDVSLYQVNMRAFSTSGNFQGVTARLDSIRALGVNVIYLMPIHPVGTLNAFNSPYAVKDYRAVNPEFGNEKVFVASNLRNATVNYTVPSAITNTNWTNAFTGTSTTLGTQITLQPYSYLVLKN